VIPVNSLFLPEKEEAGRKEVRSGAAGSEAFERGGKKKER